MELEVVKVEEGLCDGRVLFHSLINRTAAAAAAQQAEIDERQRLKAERRREQVCFRVGFGLGSGTVARVPIIIVCDWFDTCVSVLVSSSIVSTCMQDLPCYSMVPCKQGTDSMQRMVAPPGLTLGGNGEYCRHP